MFCFNDFQIYLKIKSKSRRNFILDLTMEIQQFLNILCIRFKTSSHSIQIHIKVLEGRPGTKTKVIPTTLLDFTLARYLRFRFQGMHTTLQSPNSIQWLVDRDQLNKRSFYSLRYIKIGARLDCNGHARLAKQYNDDEVRLY